jgi:glycosyltransferase involved in cell wall biosynthesis
MTYQREQWAWDGPVITFVVPWYGPHIAGGAEVQSRRFAEELCARGIPAEVFTTTAGGLNSDWTQPAFPTGTEMVNEVRVHRFAVRPRNAAKFDELNLRLLRGEVLSLLDEAIFVREIIGSDDLEAAIVSDNAQRLYIFTPYMFGTTYWGAWLADHAYFIPCLHYESYAYMTLYRRLFESAYALMFYSQAEQRLAQRMYNLKHERMLVLGGGIETDLTGNAERFRQQYGIEGPFLLYAGRRDSTKNTPLLLDYFQQYRQQGGQLALVFIGGSGTPVPAELLKSGAVFDLGFLPVQDKYDAFAAATALCQPSLNESFSIVIMESWVCGTPVLVHSNCAVTHEFSEQSGGGLHFRTYDEFFGCLQWLEANPTVARQMGQSGAAYVQRLFTWDAVLSRLLAFLRATGAWQ